MKLTLKFPATSAGRRLGRCLQSSAPTCAILLLSLGLVFAPGNLAAGTEVISNDKFSDDGASWELITDPRVNAVMAIEKVDDEPALLVDVEAETDGSGSNPEDIKRVGVQRLFGELVSERTYRLTFKAKAAKDANIVAGIWSKSNSTTPFWRTQLQILSEWKEFAFTFQSRDAVNDAVLGFVRMGDATNKYWFKDLVLTVE
ncbi:MAG: hypothetical protein ACOYMS_04175 [Terrimicrobiaceae bacterium]